MGIRYPGKPWNFIGEIGKFEKYPDFKEYEETADYKE